MNWRRRAPTPHRVKASSCPARPRAPLAGQCRRLAGSSRAEFGAARQLRYAPSAAGRLDGGIVAGLENELGECCTLIFVVSRPEAKRLTVTYQIGAMAISQTTDETVVWM